MRRLSPLASSVEPAAPWMQRPRMTARPPGANAISTQEAMNLQNYAAGFATR